MKEIIAGQIAKYSHTPYGIVGIAVGISGVVNNNRILFTPYYPLPQPDLGQILEDIFHLPVIVENESNFSVLGESAFHFGYKNMIHINVHDGIGMGILIGEHLYKGHDGYAGEFGHTILFPDGKPCPCGNCGCLEQYASEKDQDIGIGKAAPKTGRDCKTKRKGSTADGSGGRYGAQTEIKVVTFYKNREGKTVQRIPFSGKTLDIRSKATLCSYHMLIKNKICSKKELTLSPFPLKIW